LRFLSIEPLLEDLHDIDLSGIGWMFVGGMSGKLWDERCMDIRWAASLHDKARSANIPYLFRQVSAPKSEWGINTLGLYLADRDGITVNPETVHPIREFPVTDLPLMPHDANKCRRFTAEEWKTYKETKGLFRKSAKRKISALEAQGFLNQRIPEFT
jgi:hypothetical protein